MNFSLVEHETIFESFLKDIKSINYKKLYFPWLLQFELKLQYDFTRYSIILTLQVYVMLKSLNI